MWPSDVYIVYGYISQQLFVVANKKVSFRHITLRDTNRLAIRQLEDIDLKSLMIYENYKQFKMYRIHNVVVWNGLFVCSFKKTLTCHEAHCLMLNVIINITTYTQLKQFTYCSSG